MSGGVRELLQQHVRERAAKQGDGQAAEDADGQRGAGDRRARARARFAPQAWPISTEAPEPRPMTKEIRNSMSGKNAEAAASACTPIICPRKMLFSVPDSDCRMFASIIGTRNNRKIFHIGCWRLNGGRMRKGLLFRGMMPFPPPA